MAVPENVEVFDSEVSLDTRSNTVIANRLANFAAKAAYWQGRAEVYAEMQADFCGLLALLVADGIQEDDEDEYNEE